jgi:perosamine synthetase
VVESRLKSVVRVGDFRIGPLEKRAIKDVLNSRRISEGPKTREFEKKWAEFVGTRYAIATSSGAGALITALTAMKHRFGIPDGAKAIVTPVTYIATVSALVVTGFRPVFVDIDPATFCIPPENIEALLKKSSHGYKLIVPVDLMGHPAQMDEIERIARKYKLAVLEDAAEAHGSLYKGRRAGSWGDAGIFSFYIAHNIQVGEMGAVTTNDLKIACLCRQIKAQGRACICGVCTRDSGHCPQKNSYPGFDPRFAHELIGYNFKTMEFQTALALAQLGGVEKIISKRRANVRYLNLGLSGCDDIIQLPFYSDNISYMAYPLVIKRPDIIKREDFCAALEKRMVETRFLFGCIPTQQPVFAHLRKMYQGKIPHAEYVGANGFYIGCHQYLTKKDLDHVIASIRDILGR